jgi:hypothetical protein
MGRFVSFVFIFLLSISCNYTSSDCLGCGCENVDDCLSKYKFEEARRYASKFTDDYYERTMFGQNRTTKNDELYKIICTETDFWLTKNDLDKAISLSNEIKNINFKEKYDGDRISKKQADEKYCEIIVQIINACLRNNQLDKARNFSYQLPKKILYQEKFYVGHIHHKNKDKERELLKLAYINKKKELKLSQEIEPFDEFSSSYQITTYLYPQKEALKIIDESKQGNIKN